MEDQAEVDKYFEAQMPSPETLPLFELARGKGIGFYLGYAEMREEEGETRRFNTSILVGPTAAPSASTARSTAGPCRSPAGGALPASREEVLRGRRPGLQGLEDVRGRRHRRPVHLHDWRWPETFRVMGLKGAEMVALGYNTPTDNIYAPKEPPYLRVFHHHLSIQAGAYQNGIWVVATAKAGKEDGFWLIGGTAIVAPTGEIVAQSTTEDDEASPTTRPVARRIHPHNFNFAKHRRPEHYKLITERTGVKAEPSN